MPSFGRDLPVPGVSVLYGTYTLCMTAPIPTRFSDGDLADIDWLVAQGVARNRSAVIRKAVSHLSDAVRRERVGQVIAASYRLRPQSADDNALATANAVAITDAEPW